MMAEQLAEVKVGTRGLRMSDGTVRHFKSRRKRDRFERMAQAVKHGFKPTVAEGGAGSGNFGHAGRPGEVGGSGGGGGTSETDRVHSNLATLAGHNKKIRDIRAQLTALKTARDLLLKKGDERDMGYSVGGLQAALKRIDADLAKSHLHPSMLRQRTRERQQVQKMLAARTEATTTVAIASLIGAKKMSVPKIHTRRKGPKRGPATPHPASVATVTPLTARPRTRLVSTELTFHQLVARARQLAEGGVGSDNYGHVRQVSKLGRKTKHESAPSIPRRLPTGNLTMNLVEQFPSLHAELTVVLEEKYGSGLQLVDFTDHEAVFVPHPESDEGGNLFMVHYKIESGSPVLTDDEEPVEKLRAVGLIDSGELIRLTEMERSVALNETGWRVGVKKDKDTKTIKVSARAPKVAVAKAKAKAGGGKVTSVRAEAVNEEGFTCECIKCGYVETLKEGAHCRDTVCPECGGAMRRAERPGPGQESLNAKVATIRSVTEGGAGSGNFGHAGRPGEVGGSGSGGGSADPGARMRIGGRTISLPLGPSTDASHAKAFADARGFEAYAAERAARRAAARANVKAKVSDKTLFRSDAAYKKAIKNFPIDGMNADELENLRMPHPFDYNSKKDFERDNKRWEEEFQKAAGSAKLRARASGKIVNPRPNKDLSSGESIAAKVAAIRSVVEKRS